ncbi:MAG: YcjX family protein [Pseudomonadota bacterium]
MGIGDITDSITRSVEDAQAGFNELFEPVIRLGVTGLSRSGKTVFITSLVANLLHRGRMPQLAAHAEGRIEAAFLQPQPDDAVPRFDYEGHLDALIGPEPRWPSSTRAISTLRVSLKVRGRGMLSGLTGPRVIHLDIVDYPGEWLLDLPLMGLDYATWSARTIADAASGGRAAQAGPWLEAMAGCDAGGALDEPEAGAQARAFTAYLQRCRDAGLSGFAPGRFLMPGDLEGSPALTFAPLPAPSGRVPSGSLWKAFERRYEAYKRVVVKPFFRDHFARIDRQVVLIDALSAIHAGPQAVEDLHSSMSAILEAFRPGQNSWLSTILGKRVERILFAATKADHLHHHQHPRLTALVEAMLAEAKSRAQFRGAEVEALSLAALRATVEDAVPHRGATLDVVRGTLLDTGKVAALHPGDLPEDPKRFLSEARGEGEAWLSGDYQVMRFAPPVISLAPGDGPPHIRLDRAAQFLIGDRLT